MNKKDVTLSTIAERVNLSKYSVSRALSGSPGVSEDTRQRVLRTARDLNYQHPSLARDDAKADPRTILLFLPVDDPQSSEFWMNVMGGVQEESERTGQHLVIKSAGTNVPLAETSPGPMDGAIVAGYKTRKAVRPLIGSDCPTVLIGYPDVLEPIDAVTLSDRAAGHAVGRHLIDLGHTRIAFVTDVRGEPSRSERYRGLLDAASVSSNVHVDEIHVDEADLTNSFETTIRSIPRPADYPTAFFCCTDVVAFAVVRACDHLGWRVPEDVSVVGFNDYAAAVQFVPKLTTVRAPMRSLGAIALQTLRSRFSDAHGARPATHTAVTPELIVRESTATANTAQRSITRSTR